MTRILGVIGGFSTGVAINEIVSGLTQLRPYSPTMFGLTAALAAMCVIGIACLRAAKHERETRRQYREAVWQRRLEQATETLPPGCSIIRGGKTPAWLDHAKPSKGRKP